MNLGRKTSQKIRRTIVDALVPPPPTDVGKWAEALEMDLTTNPSLVERAVQGAAMSMLNRDLSGEKVSVEITHEGPSLFRAETDLTSSHGMTIEEADKVIERALLAIAGLNHRFEEMDVYTAVTGFRDEDKPLLDAKIRFLFAQIDAAEQEERFTRVIEIADLPNPTTAAGTVDVERLLQSANLRSAASSASGYVQLIERRTKRSETKSQAFAKNSLGPFEALQARLRGLPRRRVRVSFPVWGYRFRSG